MIRQLSTLLYERDPSFDAGFMGGSAVAASTNGMYPMVLPPTPPGLDYLPDPSAFADYGRMQQILPPPPPPPLPPHFAPPTHSGRQQETRSHARVYTAPAMQRTQSDYSYTFGTASRPPSLLPPLPELATQPASADPQYPDLEMHRHVTLVSPTAVSPTLAAASRSRSTTWPSSLLAPPPPLSHTLPYVRLVTEPARQYSPHEPFLPDSTTLAGNRPPPASSASPHSHKFDAAVTLASGLTANATLDESPAKADEGDYFASAELDRGLSPATDPVIDREPTPAELMAAADLAQLATTSLAYRRASTIVARYEDDDDDLDERRADPSAIPGHGDGERSRLNGAAADDDWFFPLPVH